MSKRSASEAFSKQPLSAFAAARAKKSANAAPDVVFADEAAHPAVSNGVSHVEEHVFNDIESGYSSSLDDKLIEDAPIAATITVNGSAPPVPPPLSSFRTGAVEYLPDCLQVRLDDGERLTCSGIYTLTVLIGAISVYGAFLTPESKPQTIYAPWSHALPVVIGRTDSTTIQLRDSDSAKSSIKTTRHLSPLWNGIWSPDDKSGFLMIDDDANATLQKGITGLDINEEGQNVLNRLSSEETSISIAQHYADKIRYQGLDTNGPSDRRKIVRQIDLLQMPFK
ncbi:hypothetical protein ANO11243_055140 [Dothideomycetidae sp. 11243]|nr:hypothetical protein ANO11243_055140 [fungal sp. No.11243]